MFSRKIDNKQNSAMQKKYAYKYFMHKYLHKINEQRNKLKIPHEYGIENYKALKKAYKNENNGPTVIYTPM